MADEIFTVAQTAQYLQVCEKTVRRLISANKLIASHVGGCAHCQKKRCLLLLLSIRYHRNCVQKSKLKKLSHRNSELLRLCRQKYTSLPPFMIKNVKIILPITEEGTPDLEVQAEIANKYLALEQYKRDIAEKLGLLVQQKILL